MDDPFYLSTGDKTAAPIGLVSKFWESILSAPPALLMTAIVAPLLLIIATRRMSEQPSGKTHDKDETSFWLLSYWFPGVNHGMSILRDPHGTQGNGIFTLNLGGANNKGSAPDKSATKEELSTVHFDPTAWKVASKFFGLSAQPKYEKALGQLNYQQNKYFSNQLSLNLLLVPTIHNLQTNIPQMLTFVDNQIDLQPWEKYSDLAFISSDTVELNLFSLLRGMLSHACVPAVFGHALLDKYPTLLLDLCEMDDGMVYFLTGLPAVTPWKGIFGAHMARRRVWEVVDAMQKALDGLAEGAGVEDYEWGDLEDVSELILERNKLWRDNGFTIKERGDINLLFALTNNAPLLVYWHTLYILSTPSLLSTILAEITPHVIVTAPERIGNHSTPPTLSISHEGLTKSCPLLRSTYRETLRLSLPRKSGDAGGVRDSLKNPDRFVADRFLDSPQTQTTDLSTNAGFAERECLALVAGVLMMWEFEPVGREGWKVPEMEWRTNGVCKPRGETSVTIRRRKFEWDG